MRSWILAVAALALAGCCDEEPVEYNRAYTIDGADPELARLVDACLATDRRCKELCSELIGPAPSDVTRDIVDCYLDLRDDGGYDVTVRYNDLEDCF